MSGVVCGSRLDRLLELQRQVEVQIAAERRHLFDAAGGRRETPVRLTPRPVPTNGLPGATRLGRLGITAQALKAWAIEGGLITEAKRGPVPEWIIDRYEAVRNAQQATA